MRIAPFVLAFSVVLLSGCGGPETSQANNAQANISNESRDSTNAAASNLEARLSLGDAAKVMHERHEAMEGLGKAMKALHRELDSGKPDINVIRTKTSTMASTAAKTPALFPAGTGPDVGKTRAKPVIWTQHDLFIRKAKDFLAASQAIDAAAKTGDVNKVMALHDNVDKACKACHDPFRAPEH
ncbi:MAG: c-type cytochrome [Sphingomicrobium sp.]